MEKPLERWLGPGLGAVALALTLVNSWKLAHDDRAATPSSEATNAPAVAASPKVVAAAVDPPLAEAPAKSTGTSPAKAAKPALSPAAQVERKARQFASDEALPPKQTEAVVAALGRRVEALSRIRSDIRGGKLRADEGRVALDATRAKSAAEITALIGAVRFERLEARLAELVSKPPPGG